MTYEILPRWIWLQQGEEGVRKVLEIIRDEFSLAMALSGKILSLLPTIGLLLFINCIESITSVIYSYTLAFCRWCMEVLKGHRKQLLGLSQHCKNGVQNLNTFLNA